MVRKKTRFRCVAQRGWYFLTREGRMGPFDTRREAEVMCQRYVREMNAIDAVDKGQRESAPVAFRKIA